jgi:hypothetical protein
MTARILSFPNNAARQNAYRGTVHVWANETGGFEIGHESSSGDSWGWFSEYGTAGEAVDAAHDLNARELEGRCEVFISNAVRALLPGGAA